MSTHAYICLEYDDGHIEYIYNHFDGYIDGLGEILFKYFKTFEDVERIINLGDASFIHDKGLDIEEIINKSEFYFLDKNEEWEEVKPKIANSRDEIPDIEYSYLFSNGKWFVSEKGNDWQDLEEAIKNTITNFN